MSCTDQFAPLLIFTGAKLLSQNNELISPSAHGVPFCRGCTKALAIPHHGWFWPAREAWLTSSSRWWIGAAGIRTAFASCCWTPFQMPTTAQTSVTGSSWWEPCAHSMEAATCTDIHITRLEPLPEKWGTVGKSVRETNVLNANVSSLSWKFVCVDLINNMKEVGKIQII